MNPYSALELRLVWRPTLQGFRVDSDGLTQDPDILFTFGRTLNALMGQLRIQRQVLEAPEEVAKNGIGHETAALMYDLAYELRKPDFEAHSAAILTKAAQYAHTELLREMK